MQTKSAAATTTTTAKKKSKKNPVTRFLVTPLRRYPLRVLLTTMKYFMAKSR